MLSTFHLSLGDCSEIVSFCPAVYPGLSWVHSLVQGIHWDGPHGWIYVSDRYTCAFSSPSLVLFFPLWQGIQMCVTSQCQCIAGLSATAGEMWLLLFLPNRFSFPLPFLVSIMNKCWILSRLFTRDLLCSQENYIHELLDVKATLHLSDKLFLVVSYCLLYACLKLAF